MQRPRSLRVRVAVAFAWFGAMVSLILAVTIHIVAREMGERLMDETLRAELEDYMARRLRNPYSLPPATLSLQGYVITGPDTRQPLPPPLRALPPGADTPAFFTILMNREHFRVILARQKEESIILQFNMERQREREEGFFRFLMAAVVALSALAAVAGWTLSGRVIFPVARLAAQVSGLDPEAPLPEFDSERRDDEVGDLARAFSHHLSRLGAFIQRERAFTADVSHELRTPLAVIQGATEVLQSDATLSSRQRERLGRVERAARDMAELIAALLLLAREENVRPSAEQECVMADVAAETMERHRHLLSGRALTLSLEVGANPVLPAARILARVVVGNLLANAIRHTREGSITLVLARDRLVVSDTGEGIREEELQYVFRHYYRGGASTGYGIGLSLVRRICDLYGWEIHVQSAPGRGTVVELLFFPLDPALTPS